MQNNDSENDNMKAMDLRYRLAHKGIRLVDIARRFDVSTSLVSQVIRQTSKSSAIELYIARVLELPVQTVFPNHNPRKKKEGKSQA